MAERKISEKDARRLRLLKVPAWLGCLIVALLGTSAFLNSSPTWKVHAIAVLVFALVPLLAERAPSLAALTILVCAYVHGFLITILIGTGMGTSMFYLTLTGLAFAMLGTERILLVTGFGLAAGVLIVSLQDLVPYNTGVHSPSRLFWGGFVPVTVATITTFMATVYYALRTAERAEEALARDHEIIQDKTRQLEVANKYKSHLIASASHDLRQPLHALNLFVAQLRDETDSARRDVLVTRIDASVASMNELFESLLDMTKLDAGIVEPSPTELPIRRLLTRIETTFGETAREKGLSLQTVASSGWVSSDPILLERILLNLVSNAVRYTEHGGVVVGCRRRGEMLRIDVCDTGFGIPEDQRRSIFGEFYQLVQPGAARREGLGLGLAIVDRLCRLLGHRVELESRPGRGSRFSVLVPIVAHPPAVSPTLAQAWASVDPARGKRVLVIDDDTLVLEGMRGILQGWGCHVETAVSCAAALARLRDRAIPDLIISDYRLGDGQSGIAAVEQVRAALGVRIPAFIITGDTAPERLREASASGFYLLHKPVSPMALRTTLNRLLKVRHVSVAAG